MDMFYFFLEPTGSIMGSLDSPKNLTNHIKTETNAQMELYDSVSFGMPRNRGYTAEILSFLIGSALLSIGKKTIAFKCYAPFNSCATC